jgi:IBR domain, a half RING-finger domain/Zinc finger, C3HC4 type (RING finger)
MSSQTMANVIPELSDEQFALQLQLEEAGAGVLSTSAINALEDQSTMFIAPRKNHHLAYNNNPEIAPDSPVSVLANFPVEDRKKEMGVEYPLSVGADGAKEEQTETTAERLPLALPQSHSESLEKEPCPICLESVAPSYMRLLGDCKHALCEACARSYLQNISRETKEFPIPCPTCHHSFDPQRCLVLLTAVAEQPDVERFEKLLIEKLYMPHIRYCPNERCGQPFEWDNNAPEMFHPVDFYRITCLFCYTEICVQCRDKWHAQKSCEQHRRERACDDALQILAREECWKPCPGCGELVEKRLGDCNFIRCRCGECFCHNCGVAYISTTETANNRHGTPGCPCGLWPIEDNFEDEDLDPAIAEEQIHRAPDQDIPHILEVDAPWNQAKQAAVFGLVCIQTKLEDFLRRL